MDPTTPMPPMPDHHLMLELFTNLLLFFGIAGLVVPALERLRIPPVLSYLLCGLAIGPFGLGGFVEDTIDLRGIVIRDEAVIQSLGELGVVFLMFMIGLELSFRRLWDMRRMVFGLGSAQIAATALLLFLIALVAGKPLAVALVAGGALALSSTAMIMELLRQCRRASTPEGRTSFAILLMQDIAVVPMLVAISALSGAGGEGSIWELLGRTFSLAGLALGGLYLFGRWVLPKALLYLSRSSNPEWLLGLTLFMVTASALITHSVGLSAALGAFLGGLLIAETEYRHEIEVIIEPVKGMLLGFFFLSVGMGTDIGRVLSEPLLLISCTVGLFAVKSAALFPLCLRFGIPRERAGEIAVTMAQCGEFAFVIIGMAMAGDIIPVNEGQFLLVLTALSMLMTPLTTRLAPMMGQVLRDRNMNSAPPEDMERGNEGHVIIAGFGRVGRLLGHVLDGQMIPYLGIDQDGDRVAALRRKGHQVFFGDARKADLWRRLGVNHASAAVITVDDKRDALEIAKFLRHEWPMLPVVVRANDTDTAESLYNLGVTQVVPEMLESGLDMVSQVLRTLGMNDRSIIRVVRQQRTVSRREWLEEI